MKCMSFAVLVFSTLFASMPISAQTTIRGTVTDADTGEPLIGANVVVEGTTAGAVSDADGHFAVSVAGPLPVMLRLSYIGYALSRVQVNDAGPEVEVPLEPRIMTSGAVVVSASRRSEKITDAPAAISVFYARDVEALTLTNPVEVLRGTAGVDVSEQGINSYTVTLRGRNLAFDTATRILIDHRHATTPGLAVTIFGRQALNPDDIERIEVVQGPGSALYGTGVDAGVIHFITKNPFDHPGTTVSVAGGSRSSMRFDGTHRGVVGRKLGYKVSAMYASATNWEYDPADPDDAAFIGVFPDSITSGVDGRLTRVIDGIDPETFSYGGSGSLEYRFGDATSLTGAAGYTWYKGINRFGLGEVFNEFPETFGQLRFSSGRFFAQADYLHAINDERTFLYRTGRTVAFNNRQVELQVQHASAVPSIRTDLVYGGDFKLVTTDTKRTINGRFEDDDETVVFGAYAQSQTDLTDRLALTLAGRVDRFDTIGQTFFSPRAGLVFRPTAASSARMTYNRAYSAPTNLSLFTDISVARLSDVDPAFADVPGFVQLIGGITDITFDDPRVTVPFLPGASPWNGVGVPLDVAYAVAVGSMAGQIPSSLLALFQSKEDEISGFSNGITANLPANPSVPGADIELNGQVRERDYVIKPRRTDMVEVGGTLVMPRFYLAGSVYYAWMKDFESDIRLFSPLVVAANLPGDLADAASAAFSDQELQQAGIDRATLEGMFAEAGDAMAVVGLIQPDQYPFDGVPRLASTFVNYGSIDYAGVELSATALVTERVSLTASYTFLSQVEFDDEDLGLPGTQERYALNLPRNSIGAKIEYREGTTGISGSVSFRHKDSFEGDFGDLFAGSVDEQNLVDAAVGYTMASGLSLNLTAQNVFDSRYRSFVGLPKVGRLVLASVRYSF